MSKLGSLLVVVVVVEDGAAAGAAAVSTLADMLADAEIAVAVEAARGLRTNRGDAALAIGRLTKALSREHLGETAADALSAYGVAARQAIPALVKTYPTGGGCSPDTAKAAMQHIGPPREADIPLLCENLSRDEETRMVVAESLGLLGVNACGLLAPSARTWKMPSPKDAKTTYWPSGLQIGT